MLSSQCQFQLKPGTGLLVVAALAERLPVVFIPEQLLIAAVRDDVVNHSRRSKPAFEHTLRAKRMFLQKGFSRSAPLSVVSSRIRTAAHAVG